MLKQIAVLLPLSLACMAIPAVAVNRVDVTYINGTVKGLSENTASSLDTSAADAMELSAGASHAAIPYKAVTTYDYREENRFRLGVFPAIAVGIVKARSKRHLITIEWADGDGVAQTATFDTSKDRARGLMSVLDARSPQARSTGLPWRKGRF